jgi:hypothetical protein
MTLPILLILSTESVMRFTLLLTASFFSSCFAGWFYEAFHKEKESKLEKFFSIYDEEFFPRVGLPLTKTIPGRIDARQSFTFNYPTSVQCADGGCCPIGDYCAIRSGQLGCYPIGSLCDASPIPGCSV